MGGVCCCFSPDDFEDYNVVYPNGSVYQNCFCLRCCVRRFLRLVLCNLSLSLSSPNLVEECCVYVQERP
jgi:hypothetical protein